MTHRISYRIPSTAVALLFVCRPQNFGSAFSSQPLGMPSTGIRNCRQRNGADGCSSRKKYSQWFVPIQASGRDVQLHMSLSTPPSPKKKDPAGLKEIDDDGTFLSKKEFDPLNLSANGKTNGVDLASKLSVDNASGEMSEKDDDGEIGIWVARAILLMVAILWGTNFASVKYLETLCFHPPCNHPPSEAALARFGVAALVSLPILFNKRKDVIFAGLECGFWIALGYFAQAQALTSIPSGKCAFICSLTVVVVPIISYFLNGTKIKPVNLASAVLAIGGVSILEGLVDVKGLMHDIGFLQPAFADTTASVIADSSNALLEGVKGIADTAPTTTTAAAAAGNGFLGLGRGDLLALGQPIGFGYSFMRIEHYVEKYEDVPNQVLTIAAAQCVAVGLLSLGWVLLDFHGQIPDMAYMLEPHRLGAIAWTGIMTTVVAIYFEGVALQVASATEAALLFASEPVWASFFGALLLHEKLYFNSYVGGSVILSACILSAVSDLVIKDEKVDGTDAIDVTDS